MAHGGSRSRQGAAQQADEADERHGVFGPSNAVSGWRSQLSRNVGRPTGFFLLSLSTEELRLARDAIHEAQGILAQMRRANAD